MGGAGDKGEITACALGADIRASFCEGAMEALGWQLDLLRVSLVLNRRRQFPHRVDRMGCYILSVVDFGKDASRKVRAPAVSASFFEWAFVYKTPNLSNGGLHLIDTVGGVYRFKPLRTFSACTAVTLRGSMDGCPSGRNEIVMRLQVNRGRTSAQQVKRVWVEPDRENMHLLTRVDDVSEQLEVCRAFDKATRDTGAGTSTVALFKEKLQVDLSSWVTLLL